MTSEHRGRPATRPASVGVCVTTYKRPDMLREAVASCINQTRLPDEILVSDDADDDSAAIVLEEISAPPSINLRYSRNDQVAGGVGGNINNALLNAESDYVVVLHDDDLLLPNALELLSEALNTHADCVAAYGLQRVVSHGLQLDEAGTAACNKIYYRSAKQYGLQESSIWSALVQQLPNDGYMVKRDVAAGVLHDPQYGNASEVDFGIRLAEEGKFFLVDDFTCDYRLSDESLARSSKDDSSLTCIRIFEEFLKRHPELRTDCLRRIAEKTSPAISQAVALGRKREAIELALSRHYRQQLFTPRGLRSLFRAFTGV